MTLSQCLSLHFLMSFQAEQPVSRPLRSRSNPEKAYVSSDEETSPFRMKSLHRKSHPPLEQRRYNRSPPPGHLPHHHPEHAAIHPDIHPDIHPAIHPIIHPVIHPPHLAPPEVQVSAVVHVFFKQISNNINRDQPWSLRSAFYFEHHRAQSSWIVFFQNGGGVFIPEDADHANNNIININNKNNINISNKNVINKSPVAYSHDDYKPTTEVSKAKPHPCLTQGVCIIYGHSATWEFSC